MPQHQVKLIVNPNADLGRAWRRAADLRYLVDDIGGADWAGTVYPSHAAELAHQAAAAGYKLVIAAGGDGTVHEVINGLMQVPPDQRPHLGVIPLGSGNDFSHALGISPDPRQAVRQAFGAQKQSLDIGLLEDGHGRQEYWANAVGIGFDATVTIRSRRFSYLSGFLIYFLAVLQTILLNHDAPHFQVETDQEDWRADLLMLVLCNGGREGGGFQVSPPASIHDGVLNYTAVNRISRLAMLRLLPAFMNGAHAGSPHVRAGTFRHFNLQADRPLTIHVDGEIYAGFGTDVRALKLKILPSALQVAQ